MGQNLTGQLISATYEDLVQISGSILTDGTGVDITSLTVTSSFATTASYALNVTPINTGSFMVTGSVSSNTLTFTKGDGSTFNLTVNTGSAVTVNTGSLLVTASISDATTTFTKGDGSTFSLTANNVVNATSASFATTATTATSASFATNANTANSALTATSASHAVNSNFAITASFAQNVIPINTGSFYVSSSVNNATITFNQGDGTTEAVTVNNVVNANSASVAINANTAVSASFATNANTANSATTATSASFATNASTANSATTATSASFAATASLAQNIVPGLSPTFTNATVTNNLTVNGTASIAYLNYVTGSATYIGDAFVVVNTDLPAQRYAGLAVFDSGSSPQVSASLEWDGQTDIWLLKEETGNTSVILTGPTGSRGAETFPTINRLQKGLGSNYIGDSSITDNGTTVSMTAELNVTGGITASAGFLGNLTGNASTATSASYAATASYVELGTSATASFTSATTWTFTHNLNQQPVVVQVFDSNWEEIIPETLDLTDANTATITFPVAVAGYAVASLGNGVTQGSGGGGGSTPFTSPIDALSYYLGAATSPSLYRQKLTISSPGIYNLHVSESGPYWVDLRGLGSSGSGSVNVYMWADQLSTFSANTGSVVVFTGQSGSGNYAAVRTIITGSNSTEYLTNNTTIGATSATLARTSNLERRETVSAAGNPTSAIKYADGSLVFNVPSGNSAFPSTLYKFTGSLGTPIV